MSKETPDETPELSWTGIATEREAVINRLYGEIDKLQAELKELGDDIASDAVYERKRFVREAVLWARIDQPTDEAAWAAAKALWEAKPEDC